MERVVSGIRPTGDLHLGNYFGAMKSFVEMQNKHHCFFFIADYHSLTTHPRPENLQTNVRRVLANYLAAGLCPQKATIYIQSDVPEVTELYLLLNMNVYMGELERCTSFKEKLRKQPDNVNAGLLTYPSLMAADILLHRAVMVPVGKDQEQHLEMTRTFAKRFNRIYNTEYFPEPKAYNFGNELIKIPGLDGSGKMGKSEGENNAIFLAEEPASIKKKIMRAVTDAGPLPGSEMSEGVKNLFTLMDVVSEKEVVNDFRAKYEDASIKYGELKKQLAEDMIKFTAPFREKVNELLSDMDYLSKVAAEGAEKASQSARKTIREVREIIGIKSI